MTFRIKGSLFSSFFRAITAVLYKSPDGNYFRGIYFLFPFFPVTKTKKKLKHIAGNAKKQIMTKNDTPSNWLQCVKQKHTNTMNVAEHMNLYIEEGKNRKNITEICPFVPFFFFFFLKKKGKGLIDRSRERKKLRIVN